MSTLAPAVTNEPFPESEERVIARANLATAVYDSVQEVLGYPDLAMSGQCLRELKELMEETASEQVTDVDVRNVVKCVYHYGSTF